MKKNLLYILVCILCVLIGFLVAPLTGCCDREPEVRVEYKTDTIRETVLDTLVDYYPISKHDTVFECIYIPSDTILYIVQKHYSKDSMYDAWISGIEPLSLDSILVPKHIETVTVNNVEIHTVVEQKWNMYVLGGFRGDTMGFSPEVGICISSPKKLSLGLNLGIRHKLGLTYGINIGYKIF